MCVSLYVCVYVCVCVCVCVCVSTWRDISLLPSVYKVFMKCLLSRILPWLVDAGILSNKQKAYIERQGMNEHVFCLKPSIDDFKQESANL